MWNAAAALVGEWPRIARVLAFASVLLVLCTVPPAAARADTSVRNSQFLIELPGAGAPVAAKLEVLVGGTPQSVLALRPVRPSPIDLKVHNLEVTVFFDAPLIGANGLETAVRVLTSKADRLAALGPVEVVLADPLPAPLLAPTREPGKIRDAIKQVGEEAVTVGELSWLRQRFISSSALTSNPASARDFLRREEELISERRAALLSWAASRSSNNPGLLLLVQDGFDEDSVPFYLDPVGETYPVSSPDPVQKQLAATLSAQGWRVVSLAFGQRSGLFSNPYGPLLDMARATGGTLVNRPKGVDGALERAAQGWIVSAAITGSEGGATQPLQILYKGSEKGVRAPRWASACPPDMVSGQTTPLAPGAARQSNSAIRVLLPSEPVLTGNVRFQTVTGRRRIDRVVFSLDGTPIDVDPAPPFTTEVDLGPVPLPRELRAEAFSHAGRKLGDDRIIINEPARAFDLSLQREPGESPTGEIVFTARVSAPLTSRLLSVDFYSGGELLASDSEPPYGFRLPAGARQSESFVRAVARLEDGTTIDDAAMIVAPDTADRLEVNLIELFAVVSQGGQLPPRLRRDDFTIFQNGELQPIRQFADSREMPLLLGLAIDTSESMQSWMAPTRQAAARFLSEVIGDDDKAFLIQFDTGPRIAQAPTGDLEQLERRLGGLRTRGDTVLYDGLIFSLLQFQGQADRRALVVLTDGLDEGSRFDSRDCIREALSNGVPIYFMILGQPPDPVREPRRSGLARLARQTGGRMFYLGGFDDLDRIYDRIRIELENQYLLGYSTAESLSREELADVEVRVRDKKLSVRAVPANRAPGG